MCISGPFKHIGSTLQNPSLGPINMDIPAVERIPPVESYQSFFLISFSLQLASRCQGKREGGHGGNGGSRMGEETPP